MNTPTTPMRTVSRSGLKGAGQRRRIRFQRTKPGMTLSQLQLHNNSEALLSRRAKAKKIFKVVSNGAHHFGTAFFGGYAAMIAGDFWTRFTVGAGIGLVWGIGYPGFKILVDDYLNGHSSSTEAWRQFGVVSASMTIQFPLSTVLAIESYDYLSQSALETFRPGVAMPLSLLVGSFAGAMAGLAVEEGVRRFLNRRP